MNSTPSEQTTHQFYDYKKLSQKGRITAEYIWIDGSGQNTRSKTRTLEKKPTKVEDLPEWNYDGSSCYQAVTENSEVIMRPVAFFDDPFSGGDNILVLTEAFNWKDKTFTELVPSNTNFRHFAKKIMDEAKDEEPWFGIEQEYTLFEKSSGFTKWPLGWPQGGFPGE
jgi:glutamine synthetase